MTTTKYVVTCVNFLKQPPLLVNEHGTARVEEGYQLKLGDKLITASSKLEIRDNNGLILRLGNNSDLDFTDKEITGKPTLVFGGEIYKTRMYGRLPVTACGKYRTSCYQCPQPFFVQPLNERQDVFYSLYDKIDITEYDENGEEFLIVSVPESQKVVLEWDETQQMRQRYHVVDVTPITDSEYDYITENYVNPKKWLPTLNTLASLV